MPKYIKCKKQMKFLSPNEDDINMKRELLLAAMEEVQFQGDMFCARLESMVKDRQERKKPPRKIRYLAYCQWALALKRNDIGAPDCFYTYPPILLSFLRALEPNDIVGEYLEEGYKVTFEEFCSTFK